MANKYQIAPVALWSYERPVTAVGFSNLPHAADYDSADSEPVATLRGIATEINVYRWLMLDGADTYSAYVVRLTADGPAGIPHYAAARSYPEAMRIAVDAVAADFYRCDSCSVDCNYVDPELGVICPACIAHQADHEAHANDTAWICPIGCM